MVVVAVLPLKANELLFEPVTVKFNNEVAVTVPNATATPAVLSVPYSPMLMISSLAMETEVNVGVKLSVTNRFIVSLVVLGLWFCGAASGDEPDAEFFEKRVRPLLVQHCYECHSAESKKLKGGLRLDSREAVLRGGDSGPAAVAGDPETSRLVVAVSGLREPQGPVVLVVGVTVARRLVAQTAA